MQLPWRSYKHAKKRQDFVSGIYLVAAPVIKKPLDNRSLSQIILGIRSSQIQPIDLPQPFQSDAYSED